MNGDAMCKLEYSAIKVDLNHMLFRRKPQYCIKCNHRFDLVKNEKIVSRSSPEAVNYEFRLLDMNVVGNVKFVKYYFKCPNCGFAISVDDLWLYRDNEKRIKKGGK